MHKSAQHISETCALLRGTASESKFATLTSSDTIFIDVYELVRGLWNPKEIQLFMKLWKTDHLAQRASKYTSIVAEAIQDEVKNQETRANGVPLSAVSKQWGFIAVVGSSLSVRCQRTLDSRASH